MAKPELLSPAGSYDSLVAAVRAGADVVYLGVGAFNARRNAHNFSIDSTNDTAATLAAAVSFCHTRGVKVHVALNTVVRDREMHAALVVARAACECGADALIVADRGLARRIHAAAPTMPLHASTQLTCHTPAGVRALRDAGFSRVVLAREMSRDEIAACRDLGAELEMFVHGALCMCVSGQCELSAMLGGRSGNRGLCAQPCRLPFAVGHSPKEGDTALSLKDNALYAHIDSLCELGVDSLKIEGRMKRPEYVAAATAVYRQLLDGTTPDPQLLDDVQAVFSRSGFTDGYFTGRRDASLFGSRQKEDIAAPAVLSRLQRLYDRETPRVSVRLHLDGNTLTATDTVGNTATATLPADTPQYDNAPNRERVCAGLCRTGGTPFTATATAENIPAVPMAAINALRRETLDTLLKKRGTPVPHAFGDGEVTPAALPSGFLRGLVARAATAAQVTDGADTWIVPLGVCPDTPRWGVEIPRGMFGRETAIVSELHTAATHGAAFALCHTVGAVPLARAAGLVPVTSAFYNITNTDALASAAAEGVEAAVLSFELAFPQLRFAESAGCTGLFAYGRQPLMLLRACPASVAEGCTSCNGNRVMVDRTGARFPLHCAGGCTELLNAVPLYLADKLDEIPRTEFLYLHFTDEDTATVRAVLRDYREGGTPPAAFTRGLYKRGVE